MRNFALEAEISAQARNLAGPLSYWRLLPASTFNQHRVVVETALENGGAIFDHGSGGIVLLRAA